MSEHFAQQYEDGLVVLRFGGGLRNRASVADIDERECFDGENFDIDIENGNFVRRPVLDLVGTATNAEEIRGFAQLNKTDGTNSTLVQAGGTVYEFDGSTFTSVGTVPANSKLRGKRSHNFFLDDYVIITDLEKNANVKRWDGTTFEDLPTNLGSDLKAKYCAVENERAWLSNITTTTDTPHLIAGSAGSDPTIWTVTDRPSTSLSFDDPFFLPISDLRPINGMVSAFNQIYFSTCQGKIFRTSGSDAQDFSLIKFESSSGASCDEAFIFVGNDIFIGNAGRIDTVAGVESFGDARNDDLSRQLSKLGSINSWKMVYNERVQKIYCLPQDESFCLVFNKSFLDEIARRRNFLAPFEGLSPWTKYSTDLGFAFRTQAMMSLLDPLSGQEVTYIGGQNGEVYKLEGAGGQDGGDTDVVSYRTSKLFSVPSKEVVELNGWVKHKNLFGVTLTIEFLWQGQSYYDRSISLSLEAEAGPVYNDSQYYNGSTYYNTPFRERLRRVHWDGHGSGTDVQIKLSVTGAAPFEIQELGINFGHGSAS